MQNTEKEYFEKQIIIDGMDVSKCDFIGRYKICRGYVNNAPAGKPCGCDYNPDCYYKQLQRLKAENEAMRRAIKEWEYTAVELHAEIADLKEKHNHVLNLAKMGADASEYCMRELENKAEEFKKQNESLRNHIADLLEQLNDLKEAKNDAV